MKEAIYQRKLIRRLEQIFPGCQILKLDPSENQGHPDLLILFRDQWAMLEVKFEAGAHEQPNQAYWVQVFDEMSFASFIHPQNEEQVLSDLQYAFGVTGKTRVS